MAIRPASALLISDLGRPGSFVSQPDRAWLGPVARFLGCSLDRQLAAGAPPDSNRLLATRARWLVAPPTRAGLVRSWETILSRIQRPGPARSARVGVRRDRITSAEEDIRTLLCRLGAPLPVPVRGVAMTSSLLSDGEGPLYNPRSRTDLPAALRAATAQLDASSPLVTAAPFSSVDDTGRASD